MDDLLAGLDAGGMGYLTALTHCKIQLLEGLGNPLARSTSNTAGWSSEPTTSPFRS
jgi:hypothetical protein